MENTRKILLVDDSENDVELILDAFSEVDIKNVAVVKNGMEALDFLFLRGKYEKRTDGNPLVIFLDIKMPKITGLELLRRLKEDDILKVIPVVMFTSSREENDIIKSYTLGANAYIVKPVEIEKFSQLIKELGQFWVIANEPPPVIRELNTFKIL